MLQGKQVLLFLAIIGGGVGVLSVARLLAFG
jgi:hypothetical protein